MKFKLESLNLPKVSAAGMRILDVLAKDDYSMNDVAVVVAEDPTLSGMMLKYANSPLYRRYQEVTSVRNAINLLGAKNVKLVVTLAAMRSFSSVRSIAVEKLWEHSFSIALISKLIGAQISRQLAEEMEFTGIIHDISSMTLAANFPEACDDQLKLCSEEQGYDQLEAQAFELDREALIDWIATTLHMPSTSMDAIKQLYGVVEKTAASGKTAANDESSARCQAAILALAHNIDQQLHGDDLVVVYQHTQQSVPTLLETLNLSESQLASIIDESREKLGERFML